MGEFHQAVYDELSLYVRYSAWLSAVPERAKDEDQNVPQLSRLERRREAWTAEKRGRDPDDYEPDMPPLTGTSQYVEYLFEVGPVVPAGMGTGRVSWGELESWMELTAVELEPWETRMIIRLSQDYSNEAYRATKRDRPAPWVGTDTPRVLTRTQEAIRALAKI